jgi:hypothetical protein
MSTGTKDSVSPERFRRAQALAHLVRRQSRRARYRGVRKNLFDLRRAAAI